MTMKAGLFKIDLIFRLYKTGHSGINKFEKKSILLKANNKKEAYQNALIAASTEFESRNYDEMLWEFVGLGNFQQIQDEKSEHALSFIIEPIENAMEYVQQLRFHNNSIQIAISESI